MMAKKPKYEGVLGEPMPVEGFNEEVYRQRIDALFNWYRLDPNEAGSSLRLALALAEDHVPGFRFQKPHVPDIRWSNGDSGIATAARDLMLAVEMYTRIHGGMTENRAAQIVVEKFPELGFSSADAARQRYRTLAGKDKQDRGGARANMERLIRSMRIPKKRKL